VFTRYQNQKGVTDFRGTWATVAKAAGCRDLLLHDFRRTAVRNLRNLVSESVATKITGHKAAAVFKRYDIVDQNDLADVAVRLDERANGQKQAEQRQPKQKDQNQIGYSLVIDRQQERIDPTVSR